MDEYSYGLTDNLSGLVRLLVPLVGQNSPSLGVRVNFLQQYDGIGIVDETVGISQGFGLCLPLGDLLDADTGPPICLQLIVDIPPGSKLIYPDLVLSTLQTTLTVTLEGYGVNLPPPPYRNCPNSSL